MMRPKRHRRGASLIELTIALTVVSIGMASLGLMSANAVARPAQAALERQALAIAEAYLDTIAAAKLCDERARPKVAGDIEVCGSGSWLHRGARDHRGRYLSGLEAYDVSITLVPLAEIRADAPSGLFEVRVEVSHPVLEHRVGLRAWRAGTR